MNALADTELVDISQRMEADEPGIKVLALRPLESGRFAYLIKTPFTFPRFVAGTTDAKLADVRRIVGCSLEINARGKFEEAT